MREGGEQVTGEPSRYRAFISYRHADKAWGDWLHKALESYRVPRELVGTQAGRGVVPERLGRIFRDREELAAAHDLGIEIQDALRNSANLIVICSPKAAQSHWVNEEILFWKRLGRTEQVFAIIVEGEPNAADLALECFPRALRYDLEADGAISERLAEPIAADARDVGDGRDNAKLKLIAGLLGVGFDQLRRREMEAQRRAFRRFVVTATALVVLFAGLAGAAAWFAWQSQVQRAEADRQRGVAETEKNEAEAQRGRAEKNLGAGIDTAKAFITDLTEDLKTADGAQRDFLLKMQQRALALLDALGTGQQLPESGDEAKAQGLVELAAGLIDAGNTGEAMKDAAQSLDIMQRLAKARPDNTGYFDQLPFSYDLIGQIKIAWDDLPGAMDSLNESVKVHQAIHDRHNDQSAGQDEVIADLLALIADVELRAGKPADALRDLDGATSTYGQIMGGDPNNDRASAKNHMAEAYRAIAMLRSGNPDGAGSSADDAVSGFEQLRPTADPSEDHYYERLEAEARAIVGEVYVAAKDLDQADTAYGFARHVLEQDVAADPSDKKLQFELGALYVAIGKFLQVSGKPADIADVAKKATATLEPLVSLDPLNKEWAKALADAEALGTH